MQDTDCGFTLIEVLVALALVGVTIVGALAAASADLRASRTATATLEATVLAEDALQRAELEARNGELVPGTVEQGSFEAPMSQFSWMRETRTVPGETELVEIVVAIRGPDALVQIATRSMIRQSALIQ